MYDAENRLVLSTGSNPTSLVYDPLGRLWQTASSMYGRTQFLYDGDHAVLEYDGDTGGIRRRFMWGPNPDEPIVQDEGGAMNCSGTRVLHTDHQGSVVAVADCWGNRLHTNSYDEYGIPGGSNWGRFGYTGQAWIADLGLHYYKARMYSPTLGRFLQTDPIGYDDQINLYAYVGNDPVNGRDPSGMCTGSPIGERSGVCRNASAVNPGVNGAGTSDGAVPGQGGRNTGAGSASGLSTAGSAGSPQSGDAAEPVEEARLGAVVKFANWLATKLGPKVVTPAARFPANPSQLGHIFRKAPGHYGVDSPTARAEINRALESFSHTDRFGNSIYSSMNPGGTQTWVQVRNGIIQNAGVNPSPLSIISRFP